MVQGYKSQTAKVTTHSDNSASKRTQQQVKDKPKDVQQSNASKYGAWGPTFKNREHFNSLHFS